jgi:hypothetical protein
VGVILGGLKLKSFATAWLAFGAWLLVVSAMVDRHKEKRDADG